MSQIDPVDMLFPRRWQMVFMLVSGVAIAYSLRVNISVAAVSMESSLGWESSYKGLILSSFYVGYAIGQIPSAFMTHWYGAKHLFGMSIMLSSLLTMLFPMIIKFNFFLGLVWRMGIGLAASSTFPSCYYFYKSWIPSSEKTIMVSTIMCGVYLGEIISFSTCGYFVETDMYVMGYSIGGWPACFWFFSLVGLAWFPCWLTFGYERPEDHPNMNPKELAFIRKGQQYNTVAAFDKEQEEDDELLEQQQQQASQQQGNASDPIGTESADTASGDARSSSGGAGAARVAMIDISPSSPGGTRSRHGHSPSTSLLDAMGERKVAPSRRIDNSVFTTSADLEGDDEVLDGNGDVDEYLTRSLLAHRDLERDRALSVTCSIISDTEENLKEVARRIPWGHFLKDPTSLTLLFAYYTMSFIGFMVLAEIPTFLTEELDFEIDEAGFISVAPYVAQLVAAIGFGQVFGYLQANYGWSTHRVRQTAQFICFGGSASCLVLCGFMTNVAAAVFFLVLALFMYGATQSGLACSFLDVSPNYSCSLNSLANLVGAIAGIMAPLVVSLFTYIWPGPAGWQAVFIFTAIMCVVSLYFWRKYGPCDVVPSLNAPRPKKTVNYKEWFPWFRI
jgi:MFS family permease